MLARSRPIVSTGLRNIHRGVASNATSVRTYAATAEAPVASPSSDWLNEEWWDDPSNWDPHDYLWKCKVDKVTQGLDIVKEDIPKFLDDVDASAGYFTLEWIFPSPPPFHTFEELPIIKEVEGNGM